MLQDTPEPIFGGWLPGRVLAGLVSNEVGLCVVDILWDGHLLDSPLPLTDTSVSFQAPGFSESSCVRVKGFLDTAERRR